MNIEQALRDFAVQLEADGRSAHTRAQYERHIGLLVEWLVEDGRSLEIEHIGHRDLAGFLVSDLVRLRQDGRPRKATSANTIRSSLRVFFGYLHAAGYLPRNPARLVRLAVCGPVPPRALSEAEQARLLDALAGAKTVAEKRDAVMFRLLLVTGARLGAVLAAEIGDFSAGEGELWLRKQKGGREGPVFLAAPIVADLIQHIGERREGALFLGRGAAPIGGRQVGRRLNTWLARAGVQKSASPHSLRHTFGTNLYNSTGDLALVGAALGHASISSTAVYAAASTVQVRQAVAPQKPVRTGT